MLRRVTLSRDDLVFHVFAFLVSYFQRTTIRRHDIDLQLAIAAIELRIGRAIRDLVLVANVSSDVVKNLREFRLKPRLVIAAPGQASESLHLIIGLQIIHPADWDASS